MIVINFYDDLSVPKQKRTQCMENFSTIVWNKIFQFLKYYISDDSWSLDYFVSLTKHLEGAISRDEMPWYK